MAIQKILSDTRVPVKIWTNDVEDEAVAQLKNTANLPFIFKHVAVMPDVHFGLGATIGSVLATEGAIVPAAVGVDIGCGMSAAKLPFGVETLGGSERLRELRHSIERSIPVGHNGNSKQTESAIRAFNGLGPTRIDSENRVMRNAMSQLGSLGGGNHFIEICTDTEGGAWVLLHSGSRNIGNHLAKIHIERAKDLMKQYFIELPDPDLAYLAQNTPEFDAYIADLLWAQNYAHRNRHEMLDRILKDVSFHVYKDNSMTRDLFYVHCHHNYSQIENHFGKNIWVTRKGAVSARTGEYGIIPGSMGAKSFIVKGKGNVDAFCSCSHGAGRRMSRTKAKATFTSKDLALQTEGVECRKDEGVVDEIPSAYKDIDTVMENQDDLVEVVHQLKQLICVKG